MRRLYVLLEKVDPYYTQRLILLKSFYITTIMTYLAWYFQIGKLFAGFMLPIALLAPIYESALFTSYKEKKHAFVLCFCITAIGVALFYLAFQYKVTFVFVFIIFFSAVYKLSEKYLPKFKSFSVLIVVVCCMSMSSQPYGVLQIAINMYLVVMLVMLICYFCFVTYPNQYHKIWMRAYGLYVGEVYKVLQNDINYVNTVNFVAGVNHMNIMRSYRRLLNKKLFPIATRAGFHMGHVFSALCCVEVTRVNRDFWNRASDHMSSFADAVKYSTEVKFFAANTGENLNEIEIYFLSSLNKSIESWNKLCKEI